MKAIDRTILIDRYLNGEATPEEKMQVERLLSDPELSLEDRDNFRKEMELQQEIILAIQEKGLREMLQREEARIRAEKSDDEVQPPLVAPRITPLYRRIVRATSSTAIAACFAYLVVIVPQASRLAHVSNDTQLYASVNTEMTDAYSQLKGCDDASNAILEANALMQAGDYKQADKVLAQALGRMQEITSEEEQEWSEKEDIVYLRALCTIKQHKLYRSRRLLNEVVNMNSTHRAEALQLLNTIKHGK